MPGLLKRSTASAASDADVRTPVLAWLIIAATLNTVQFAAQFFGSPGNRRLRLTVESLLGGWNHFDGPEYLSIARNGYAYRQVVWFPLYPTLVRWATVPFRNGLLAAVVVSALAGLASAVLIWRWLTIMIDDVRVRRVALATILLYPYGWFLYGVVYSDAVFLALVVGAFLLVEYDRPIAAGAVGALATLTRPTGLALIVALLVLAFERSGALTVAPGASGWVRALRVPLAFDRTRLRPRTFGPLLSCAGISAFMVYLWTAWGGPLKFATVQSEYYHDPGWRTLLKKQYFDAFTQGYDGRYLATSTAQAILLAGVLLTVPAVGRRFGWGYGIFVFTLALMPGLSSGTFMGSGRYLIAAFPMFALIGEHLASRTWPRWLYFAGSSALLLLMTFGFARSWYLT